nr:Gfo/Idh/MocA family oxidoreductase [Bauldia sp.]
IAQWEHIPNLLRLADRFRLAGVADPSPAARRFVERQFGVPAFADSDALLAEPLDAVVIASPDHTHTGETLKALSRRLHVLCETPLCYGPEEADAIIAARAAAGTVVQVGSMKRFDPAYETCLDLLDPAESLRFISVQVTDPDSQPYAEVHPHALVSDLPEAAVENGRRARQRQIAAALGFDPEPELRAGFAGTFSSSLVHDVNLTHGLLDRMGIPDGEIVGASFFAGGQGGLATIRLLDGDAAWHMSYLALPGVADYRERIALHFAERIVELDFPSPYLNHVPTRLTVRRSDGRRLETQEIRPGYGEAFVRELEAFWSAIATGAAVRNTVEEARRDQALLCGLAQTVIARRDSGRGTRRGGAEAARIGRVVAAR